MLHEPQETHLQPNISRFFCISDHSNLQLELHLVCHGHGFFIRPISTEHVFHVTELMAACDESVSAMTSFAQVNDDGQSIDNQLNTSMCFAGEVSDIINGRHYSKNEYKNNP